MHRQEQEALNLYREMEKIGIIPNEYTYSIILSIIAEMTQLHEGQRIHAKLKVTMGLLSFFYSLLFFLIFLYVAFN